MAEQMRNIPDLLHRKSLHLKLSNPLHCHVFFTGEKNLQSISNSLSSNRWLILAFQNFHFLLFYQGLFQFTVLHHNWPGSMCNWHCCTTNDALEDPKNIHWMGCTTTGVVWHHLQGNHNYCTKWSPSQWRLLMVPCLPPWTRCWNTQTENKIEAFTWIPSRDNR